ncbi:MAG: hypothetical protein ABW352_21450, partial [Polyangiales bacterium]
MRTFGEVREVHVHARQSAAGAWCLAWLAACSGGSGDGLSQRGVEESDASMSTAADPSSTGEDAATS